MKRKARWWMIVIVNVAGLILIFPLLLTVVPLVGVWWHTRSASAVREPSRSPAPAATNAPEEVASPAASSSLQTNDPLRTLTNQLQVVQSLSEKDIQQIVAQHFGVNGALPGTNSQFDLPSAVFDSISKTTLVYQGKTYYGYQVDLVDQNGRHQTNIDCFTEPNVEYERSLATMELINNSPQLKRIYRAMASSLAEKSEAATNSSDPSGEPVLRLDPGAVPKQP